ncbi:MAG: hypothetical protein IH805_09205 [Proteobacteria bacterium]|nr:hypothetical protein [Pseudomonadota bacterium]
MARLPATKASKEDYERAVGQAIDLGLFAAGGSFERFPGAVLLAGQNGIVLGANPAAEPVVALLQGSASGELRLAIEAALAGRAAQVNPLLLAPTEGTKGAGQAFDVAVLPAAATLIRGGSTRSSTESMLALAPARAGLRFASEEVRSISEHFDSDSLSFPPGTGIAHNQTRVGKLEKGLSYLITHCARGGPELESITDDWRQRDEEHRIYSDGSMSRFFAEQGIDTIGMRPLRAPISSSS